ncbi:MAG: DNA starvation/stationary phase protection protein [Gammaproteobacteria bacterium]|nr:DNA starvation/stationary phase protection protein [Gammaproteobacteria bacterium]
MRINFISIREEMIMHMKHQAVSEALGKILADTFTLYLKTHNFHWNLSGPLFISLHLLFEQQYQALFEAVDVLAERIRALGFPAPGTYKAYGEMTCLKEVQGVPKTEEMLKMLLADHRTLVKVAYDVFAVAETAGDQATMDLMIQRIEAHEKIAWMLQSQLS